MRGRSIVLQLARLGTPTAIELLAQAGWHPDTPSRLARRALLDIHDGAEQLTREPSVRIELRMQAATAQEKIAGMFARFERKNVEEVRRTLIPFRGA